MLPHFKKQINQSLRTVLGLGNLKDLGVVKVGHLKRILSSLKNLKKQSNNNTTAFNSANNPNSGTSANVAAAVTATSTLTPTLSVSPIFNASDINTSVINNCSIGSIKSKPSGTFKETSMAASTATEHHHSGTFAGQHCEMSTPNHENIVQIGNIAKTIRSNNNDDDDDDEEEEDGEDDDEDDGFHEVVKL
ncbi:hypothetical protein HELRODRAFT_188508 [Helobdella robusta]|uniref:SAM domain-containing protein n=1 Tax=Helobdella robusta TaxID=6412 RepID=T1FQ27_HELRO|nr:hypothetical protein HELRODRAFT_188508 [Helobdella robusta]ESO01876.1 hypothetical protein HELRODRAFT_188508 [Helobdella robusta]